jgi:Putative transposase
VLDFHPLLSLSSSELGDLLTVIRIRVLGWLSRRGVIEDEAELGVIDQDFAAREPALTTLARASVSGLAPAGPEHRARPPLPLGGLPGVEVNAPLSVSELGFSLHAATTVRAGDARGRESLCKYVLRPAIAQERVHLLEDGLVRLVLRRPFKDGTVAIDLDPLSVLCRLAASVPPPRMHTVRFAGVLSAAHKWRSLVVPPVPDEEAADDQSAHEHRERPATHRCHYWSWARLLKRSLAVDGEKCDACGARMKLRTLVFAARSIERLLGHLGEPTELLPLSPARGPPFFKSRAVRRKMGELDAPERQVEMCGA